MTVIATDGITIAADSLGLYGNERSLLPSTKIIVKSHHIFAAAGCDGLLPELSDWYLGGRDPKAEPPVKDREWSLMTIEPSGKLYVTFSATLRALEEGVPFSIGSGSEYAIGAMCAGATPREAVEIACKMSNTCGLPVLEINISEALGLHKEAAE